MIMPDATDIFDYCGAKIDFSQPEISEEMKDAFRHNHFEGTEAKLLNQILEPGHRIIELGSSTGFVSMAAARILGPENI